LLFNLASQFKAACPPQKWKDLEQLVKQHNGDETAIQARIMEWWEEGEAAPKEEQWENVNKKKPKHKFGGGFGNERGGRARGGGPSGRGGRGSGAYRGRGGAPAHGGRGERGPKSTAGKPRDGKQTLSGEEAIAVPDEANAVVPGVSPSQAIAQNGPVPEKEEKPVESGKTQAPAAISAVEGFVSSNDPTPSGRTTTEIRQPKPVCSIGGGGNVWATKGSAHLIQAEKPKPQPPLIAPAQSAVKSKSLSIPPSTKAPKNDSGSSSQSQLPSEPQPLSPELLLPVAPSVPLQNNLEQDVASLTLDEGPFSVVETELDFQAPVTVDQNETDTLLSEASSAVGLSASVNGANVNAAGWKPIVNENGTVIDLAAPLRDESELAQEDIRLESAKDVVSPKLKSSTNPLLPPKEIVTSAAAATKTSQATVLNMGRWDVNDSEEQAIDFGFGSFGPENDDVVEPPAMPESKPANGLPAVVTDKVTAAKEAAAATALSPARPPPGLGLGGGTMPPMPAGAVLVHELEGQLDCQPLEVPSKIKEEQAEVAPKAPEKQHPPREEPKPTVVSVPPVQETSVGPPMSSAIPSTSMPLSAPGMGAPQSAAIYPNTGYAAAPGMTNMYSGYNTNLGSGFMGSAGVAGMPTILSPQQQQAQHVAAQHAAQQHGSKVGAPFGNGVTDKDDVTDNTAASTTGSTSGTNHNASSVASAASALNSAFAPGMMAYNPAAAFGGGFYGQHAAYPHHGHQMAGQGLSANLNIPYGAYGGYPPAQFGAGAGGYASAYQQQMAAQMGVGGGVGGPPGSNQGGSLAYGLGAYGDSSGGSQGSTGEQHLGLAGVGSGADSRGVAGGAYGNKSNYRNNRNNQTSYNQGGGVGYGSHSQSQYNQHNPSGLHQQHGGLGYGGGGISNPYATGMGGYGSQGMDHFQAQRGYGGVGVGLHSSAHSHNPYGMQQQNSYGAQGLGGGFGQESSMDSMDSRGAHNKNKGNKGQRGGGFGNSTAPHQFQQSGVGGPPFGLQSQGPEHGTGGGVNSVGGNSGAGGWGQQSWGGGTGGQSWQQGN